METIYVSPIFLIFPLLWAVGFGVYRWCLRSFVQGDKKLNHFDEAGVAILNSVRREPLSWYFPERDKACHTATKGNKVTISLVGSGYVVNHIPASLKKISRCLQRQIIKELRVMAKRRIAEERKYTTQNELDDVITVMSG